MFREIQFAVAVFVNGKGLLVSSTVSKKAIRAIHQIKDVCSKFHRNVRYHFRIPLHTPQVTYMARVGILMLNDDFIVSREYCHPWKTYSKTSTS